MSEDKQEDQQDNSGPRFTSELDSPAMFDDPTLPAGWERKVTQRQTGKSAGKFDVYIFSPEGKKFRSRNELASYFDKVGSEMSALDFDFSVRGHSNKKSPSAQPSPSPVKKATSTAKKPKKEASAKPTSSKKSAATTPTTGTPSSARPGRKLVVKLNFTSPKKRILKNYSENKGEREQAGQTENKETKPKEATKKVAKKEEAEVSSEAKAEIAKKKKEELRKEEVLKKNKENDLARKKGEASKAAKPTKDVKGKKMKLLEVDNMLFKEFDRLERKPPKEKTAVVKKDSRDGQSTTKQAQVDDGSMGPSREEVSSEEQNESMSPVAFNTEENGEASMSEVADNIRKDCTEDTQVAESCMAEKTREKDEVKKKSNVEDSENMGELEEVKESEAEDATGSKETVEDEAPVEDENLAKNVVEEAKKGKRGKASPPRKAAKDSKTTEKATKEQSQDRKEKKKKEKIVVAEERKAERSHAKGKPEKVPEAQKKKTEKGTPKSEKKVAEKTKSTKKEERERTVQENKSSQKRDTEKATRQPKEDNKKADPVKPDKKATKASEAATLVEAEASKVEEPPHPKVPQEKQEHAEEAKGAETTAQAKQKGKREIAQTRASEPANAGLRDNDKTVHDDPGAPVEDDDMEGEDGEVECSPKLRSSDEQRPWPTEMSPCMIDHSYTKLPSEEDHDLNQKQSPSRKRTRSGGSDGSPRRKWSRRDPAEEHEPVEEES